MAAYEKPEWLPDWRNEDEYPDPEKAPPEQWAWEFLRRSPLYQEDYVEFEEKIIPEIQRQAKEEIISDATAQLFIGYLEKEGRDCLLHTPDFGADDYHDEPENKLCLPWIRDSILNDDCDSFDAFIENWDKQIPEIIEPSCFRNICERYGLRSVQNPAQATPPFFTKTAWSAPVPFALERGDFLNCLTPETENEIAFIIDLQSPISEQISFIKKLCVELKVKTDKRIQKPKTNEWLKQIRLLDAVTYGPQGARKTLAEEWEVTYNNLVKKHLRAEINRDAGYKRMVPPIATASKDPHLISARIKYLRSLWKIELTDNMTIEEMEEECRKLRQQSLARFKAQFNKE